MKLLPSLIPPGADPARIRDGIDDMERRRITQPTFVLTDGSNERGVYDYLILDGIGAGSIGGSAVGLSVARNRLIGGDFTINPWARGTTFTSPATAAYTADGFRLDFVSAATVTVTKTADAPTADEAAGYTAHCLHIDCTAADSSIAATDFFVLTQRVEGLNAARFGFGQAGSRWATLSFWVKSTKTGTFCVSLRNSAQNRAYVREYTVSSTNTWERKAVTFPVDTGGTWLYDTGIGVEVSWALMAGSNFQTTADAWAAGNYVATSNQVNALDSTSNDFKIALPQLEAGRVASPYEWQPRTTVEALCQRYTPAFTGTGALAIGHAYTTTNALVEYTFHVPPRVAPTGVTATASQFSLWDGAGALIACNTMGLYGGSAGPRSATLAPTVAAGLTVGRGTQLIANTAATMIFTGCTL